MTLKPEVKMNKRASRIITESQSSDSEKDYCKDSLVRFVWPKSITRKHALVLDRFF